MSTHLRNVILTGIPRSGTTLITALIDSMSDAVALNEPRWQYDWMMRHKGGLPADFAVWLVKDFARLRQQLLQKVPIPERRLRDGTAVTNYYRINSEEQKAAEIFEVIPFTRPGLTSDFILAIKHNGLYLSVLRQLMLTQQFTIIAILRNPVGVISSWNDVPIPLGQGKMPGAIGYWKDMRELTESGIPLLEKQVRMYDLVCQRFYNLRDHIHIIKYEELVKNPNLAGTIVGRDVSSFAKQIKKRELSFYKNTDMITAAVKKHGKFYRHFYPKLG